jgi:2-iminobutanoate/2-iminopropanoate deaminase
MSDLKMISTPDAPGAIGPYSQAVVVDDWVFLSGQIPIDPATGELIVGDVTAQTHRVMKSLVAVLEAAGSSLSKVVKTTCYLSDMGNFSEMNAVYAEYFGDHRPARATVQAAGLPKAVDVEIDVIAKIG